MKAQSYISLVLTLCFSIFLGHNLVPHHHHAEHVHAPLAAECPIDHGDSHNHGDGADPDYDGHAHPKHCHAFNDVVFHKYNSIRLPEVSQDISTLFVPVTLKVAPPLAEDLSTPFVQIKIPDKLLACLGSRSLRAPPFLVSSI